MGGKAAKLAVLLVSVVAAMLGPATSAASQAFTYSGRCDELQLGARADAGALTRLVPQDFLPVGSPLAPIVTVGVARCDATTANGEPISPWTASLVGTPVVPRGPNFERYWLWNVGDSPEVDEGFADLGLETAVVPGIELEIGPSATGIRPARAHVPWERGPYGLEADVVDAPGAPLQGTSVFWHRGPRGLVKVTYEISGGAFQVATGRITAAPGSPLAELVGTDATALGLLITFSFESTSELVG